MFNDLCDKFCRFDYRPEDQQMIGMLQEIWAGMAPEYVCSYLKRRMAYESIRGTDVCRVELRADDVRSAVYANIHSLAAAYPVLVENWFDLTIDTQDMYLREAFPDNQVYGV